MKSKHIALLIAKHKYPTYTVVIIEPLVYLIAPRPDRNIIPTDQIARYADLIFDCTEQHPTIVKNRPTLISNVTLDRYQNTIEEEMLKVYPKRLLSRRSHNKVVPK